MTTRFARMAWGLGLMVAAGLAGAGAYTAANAGAGHFPAAGQYRAAPMPQTVEPPFAPTIPVSPVPQPANSPPPTSITLPEPPENPLRPDQPSLTFNPRADTPDIAPQILPTTPAPGDAPVNLTKQAILSTMISAALAAGPVNSQGTGDANKPVDVKAELDELKKQVNEMKTTQKQIADVILGRNEWKMPEDAGLQKRLDAMAEAIKKLDEKLAKIGEQVNTTQRVVGSSPINNNTPLAKGTLRLVNNYHVEVPIIVNGVSYLLAPSQTREVAVAPGDFGYSLPQSGGIETKSKIKDGETVTLRIK